MFYRKRESELLQSRPGAKSRPCNCLLNVVENALPAQLSRETRQPPSQPDLQIHSERTAKACRPKVAATALFQGEIEFPGGFRHIAQVYLKGTFVQWPD
jgi:hypothetical protein